MGLILCLFEIITFEPETPASPSKYQKIRILV